MHHIKRFLKVDPFWCNFPHHMDLKSFKLVPDRVKEDLRDLFVYPQCKTDVLSMVSEMFSVCRASVNVSQQNCFPSATQRASTVFKNGREISHFSDLREKPEVGSLSLVQEGVGSFTAVQVGTGSLYSRAGRSGTFYSHASGSGQSDVKLRFSSFAFSKWFILVRVNGVQIWLICSISSLEMIVDSNHCGR